MVDSKKETETEATDATVEETRLPTNEAPQTPVEDAKEIIEEAEEILDADEADAQGDPTEETAPGDETPEELNEETAAGEMAADATHSSDEPVDVEPEAAPIPPAPAPDPKKSGGFGKAVLGGLIVAALGFGGASYLTGGWPFDDGKDQMADALAAQDARLTALTESLQQLNDNMSKQGDGAEIAASLEKALGGRFDALSTEMGGLSDSLAAIDARLTEVEKRPITGAPDVSGAIAAYERELEELRADLDGQRSQNEEIAALADQAKAEIAETTARAAMMRMRAALESGGSFSAALSDLGIAAPAELSAVADSGVATLASLKADFPAAARAALSASLRENTGADTTSKIGNFLRSQLGVRSLAPREGDDPDAILSRAEAALGEGRVADALTELTALPEGGQTALADWAAAAKARVDAEAAVAALAEQLNMN